MRTDACTTVVMVLDGLRTEDDTVCPPDVTLQADDGRLDKEHSWDVPEGWFTTHGASSRFRLGSTVVYMWTAAFYCSFSVTVLQRKSVWAGGGQ